MSRELQDLCGEGQAELMATRYAEAERLLAEAEELAFSREDWDTLARLYMPLQESRRQLRLRCGEGEIRMDLVAEGPHDHLDGHHVVENIPFGQLLVAGWGTMAPAIEVRRLQRQHALYVETLLGAVFPLVPAGRVIAIIPFETDLLPDPDPRPLDELRDLLPPHSLLVDEEQLPPSHPRGTMHTFSAIMTLWERLHAPFLAAAAKSADPRRKIDACRTVIAADYACEPAHQWISKAAHELVRQQ